MANGKCRFHGGATPKGAQWHKPQWPAYASKAFEQRLARKLELLAEARRKRDRRIAAMTAEELAAYRAWQRTHQPGPPGPRARRRAETKSDAALAKILAAALEPRPSAAISAELAAIEAEIERLQAETAALNVEAARIEGASDDR